MEYVVSIDEYERIILPVEVGEKHGLKGKRKVLIRVRDDCEIELIAMDKVMLCVFLNTSLRIEKKRIIGRQNY